jgi:CubicO group peptidase (beta-lactamase class C family)
VEVATLGTLVARHGKVVHFEALGSQNIDEGRPMQRDTIFRLYSQTKPVTTSPP